jgi:thiamine pyrophosphate-dependent acetolactate synthase large subunit-like protein
VTVADVVADVVRRAGVAHVVVADGADPMLAAALSAADIPLVRVHADADACTMAVVGGRVTAAPGVACLGAAGVDVRRALTAAWRDHVPAIMIAANDPTGGDVVKAVASATPESAAHWAAHAVHAATTEPPGPVWLTLRSDVVSRAAVPVATALHRPGAALDTVAIDEVAAAIAQAARPLILAGRECRAPEVAPWLRALAEALPAPTLVTPAARGALPDPHPLCFGVLRSDAAVLGRADLLVALGVDDEELATAAVRFGAPVVRLGGGTPWDAGRAIVRAVANGAIAPLIEELAPRLRDRARADWDVAEMDRIRRLRVPPPVDPALATLVARLREATPVGTAVVFATLLEDAALHWQAVTTGEVLIDDRPIAAAAALALARGDGLVLAFAPGDVPANVFAASEAAVEILTPARETLGGAVEAAVTRRRPSVVIVPLPG